MLYDLLRDAGPAKLTRIIISSDNTGTLQQIFQGSPGKAQTSSTTFQHNILNLLDQHMDLCITITWCPGHSNIEGNKTATTLAKSGSHLTSRTPDYKTSMETYKTSMGHTKHLIHFVYFYKC